MKKFKDVDGFKKEPFGRRVAHVDDGWSYVVSNRKGDKEKLSLEQLAKQNRLLSITRKECADKELELRNAAGPSSTPERHYPKSFIIQPKKEEDE